TTGARVDMTELPAYGLGYDDEAPQLASAWPQCVSREGPCGGAAVEGVAVCLVDSGVRGDHPLVGRIDRAVTVTLDDDGEPHVHDDETGDVSGHGTACAGIVRAIAPAARITSVRVLGADLSGGGTQLLAGLGW